jgi:xanthine dehydrogenase YagS FAD-binding subunit
MKAFQYTTASSADSAPQLRGNHGRYLAGGIDLLGEMKEYIAEPEILVNIKGLPGLDKIEPGKEFWSIGTNVTIAELENHPEIKQAFPGIQQAAAEVGSPQIRNVATIGGNLAQHSRCWYYRHRDIACLKKGGDTCYARNGENKYHSLFTGNTCISPVVSNLSVILAALDASVIVQRTGQPIRMSIADFYAKSWDNPTAHHSLEPGDLVLRVEIPVMRERSSYLQVSEKAAFDWALVSCAAAAKSNGGKLTQARVVLGAVANVPYQSHEANALLEGKTPDEALGTKVADVILQNAEPLSGNAYKVQIAKTLIRRCIAQLKA